MPARKTGEAATHLKPCTGHATSLSPVSFQIVLQTARSRKGAWLQIAIRVSFSVWRACGTQQAKRKGGMLYTIALVLIIAWLLGIVSSYTLGGFIYILLVIAIVLILIRLIQRKRV
jgi:hypothetical protein